jgi:hypothetical protein
VDTILHARRSGFKMGWSDAYNETAVLREAALCGAGIAMVPT